MIISKYLQPLDGMKRITRQELADHFDEILETVETDNIGYVIKDPERKNDVVLCPAEWFDFCFDEDFGCIVNSALRYAISRHTYMPSVVRNFIRKYMRFLMLKHWWLPSVILTANCASVNLMMLTNGVCCARSLRYVWMNYRRRRGKHGHQRN